MAEHSNNNIYNSIGVVQRHTQNSDGKASNQQKFKLFKLFNVYLNRTVGKSRKTIQ